MHMSSQSLLVILLVGLIAGWLAGQIVRGTGFGIVGDLVIGIIGAFIGSWLLPQLGIHLGTGIVAAIVNATIGALVLLLIIRLVRGGGGWRGSWGGSGGDAGSGAAERGLAPFGRVVMQTSHWLEHPFTADTLALLGNQPPEQKPHAAATELQAALAREAALRREMADLTVRQVMLAQEFEHRLINGLQVISSLLSLQSRAAKSSEAAEQLTIAATRVAALGRVHRRLHLLDHQDHVEFKPYLEHLCEDLSRLLCEKSGECAILVDVRGDRNSDDVRHPARLYRQRTDHQFGEIRQGGYHRPV